MEKSNEEKSNQDDYRYCSDYLRLDFNANSGRQRLILKLIFGSYLPPTKRLTAIAKLYGCTVDELLKE